MSKLKEKVFQKVVLVGLALTVGCAPEAFARGAIGHTSGGGGHSSGGHIEHVRGGYYRGGRGGYYGGGGGWGNNYGNYYGGQTYMPAPGPPGQVFSGPAHIDPSQYNNYVQTYSWPSHQ